MFWWLQLGGSEPLRVGEKRYLHADLDPSCPAAPPARFSECTTPSHRTLRLRMDNDLTLLTGMCLFLAGCDPIAYKLSCARCRILDNSTYSWCSVPASGAGIEMGRIAFGESALRLECSLTFPRCQALMVKHNVSQPGVHGIIADFVTQAFRVHLLRQHSGCRQVVRDINSAYQVMEGYKRQKRHQRLPGPVVPIIRLRAESMSC